MKKIRTIQILRIIACIGVFGGHFLGIALPSEMSKAFLTCLRNSWISRTILSYFYQGDTNVTIFYVIGGFFLVYTSKKSSTIKELLIKLLNKISNLLIPSMVIILLSSGIYLISNYYGNYRLLFDLPKLANDLRQLLVPGKEMYYAYQLWYIRVMLRCYILGTIILICITRERRFKHAIYIVCLMIFGMKQSTAYFAMVLGMMAADYGEVIVNNKKKVKHVNIFVVLLFMIAPFTYNEQHLQSINKMVLSLVVALAIFWMFIAERSADSVFLKNTKIIDWFDTNSYAFYLVHVLVLNILSYPLYQVLMIWFGEYEMGVIIVDYFISLGITWMIAYIYNSIVIKRNKMIYIHY